MNTWRQLPERLVRRRVELRQRLAVHK
jgi:hypothetical protein